MTTLPVDVEHLALLGHENLLEWFRETTRWSGRAGRIEEGSGVLRYAGSTAFPVAYDGVVRTDPAVAPDEVVAAADEWFGRLGRGYSLLASGHLGVDDDLQAGAEAAGLVLLGEMPALVLDRDVAAPVLPEGVLLEWVADEAGVDDFVAVSTDAYATLGLPRGVVAEVVPDPRRLLVPWVHTVVARRDGDALAAAQLLLGHGIAGIYWVGTREPARGTGLGEVVTRAVVNRAFEVGAAAVVLQASQMGDPIYRRMGFEETHRYHRWVRMPART